MVDQAAPSELSVQDGAQAEKRFFTKKW